MNTDEFSHTVILQKKPCCSIFTTAYIIEQDCAVAEKK